MNAGLSAAVRVRRARRRSFCALCRSPIVTGQQISSSDGRDWTHVQCFIADRKGRMNTGTAQYSYGEVGHDPPVHIVSGPWIGPKEVRRTEASNESLCGKQLSRSRGRPKDPDLICRTCHRLSTSGEEEVQPVLAQLNAQMQSLSSVSDQDYQVQFIPLGELMVDMHLYGSGRLQRTEQAGWTKKIAANFSWSRFNRQPPMVSAREDGTNHVMDGQHGVAAARLAGFEPETPVRCHVWHNLTPEQEAAIFEETNADRKSVKPLDLFRARIAKHEPVALAIDALLKAHGWEIGSHGKTGNFAAVKTLESIYNRKGGPETCHRTLWVITGAWGREPDSTHQTVVKVIGLFFRQYPDADLTRLVQVLQREASIQPHRIQMWPKEDREAWQETCVTKLRERYNNRLDPKKKLG